MSLNHIRVVLVGTTHPGNIGAAARAMKTMGLTQLVLAAPLCEPDETSLAMAANAGDLLRAARRTDSLAEAVADCCLVVGTSARRRSVEWPSAELHDAAQHIVTGATHAAAAVVFGREKSGLTNEELDECNLLVQIPTAAEAASLNLAAAVQVVAYELRRAALVEPAMTTPPLPVEDQPAEAGELHRLVAHLETTIRATGFLAEGHEGVVMRRLRSLLYRSKPTLREVRILRGILASVDNMDLPTARATRAPALAEDANNV